MAVPTTKPLPIPPNRTSGAGEFTPLADIFFGAMPQFQTDMNALATYSGQQVSLADTARIAAEQAKAAAESARSTVVTRANEVAANTNTVVTRANEVATNTQQVAADTLQVSDDKAAVADALASLAGGPVYSVNGMSGNVTGIATQAGAQTLTNKTLVDPIVTLGGTQGAAGQVPVSQGPGLAPAWGAVAGVISDYQEFTTSGTWTKPAEATWVYVEAIGGGGGGVIYNSNETYYGGGGGGGFNFKTVRASDLPSSVAVTIGAGGTGLSTGISTPAGRGGDTTFGAFLTGKGGTGAATSGGGAGGSGEPPGASGYASAGGGARSAMPGSSIKGGGGGGGGTAGGSSLDAGAGGAAGQPGVYPGGGGGASAAGAAAGAAGRVRVWCW